MMKPLPAQSSLDGDEPADLEFVRQVFAAFAGSENFGMKEVLNFVNQYSAVQDLNSSIVPNEGYCRSLYQEAVGGRAPKRPLEKSQAWFLRSKKVIPGCAQTFSKGLQPVRGRRGAHVSRAGQGLPGLGR